MAPITKSLALAGALFAACGFAAPVEKRAVVWVTVTDVVWTTVDVTTTIYPEQLGATTATVEPVTTTPAAPAVPTTTVVPQQESETQSQQQAAPAPQPETSAPAPAPAPQPETTTAPAPPAPQPTEQTTVVPEPTSTSQAPAAPVSSSGSASDSGYNGACDENSPCVGEMTYYDTATLATNPSACGTTNDGETELVLALPVGLMTDADCGKSVTIEYNGVTQTGKVVDKCMGCDNTSIDLSRALFESFASLSAGRISGAKWYIN